MVRGFVAGGLLAACLSLVWDTLPAAEDGGQEMVAQGRQVAMDRKRGNCLACHVMDNGESPGNIGPPLVAMRARFPDPQQLRAQIWDPGLRNPHSVMPPFGRHGILTEREIDQVVAYLYTL